MTPRLIKTEVLRATCSQCYFTDYLMVIRYWAEDERERGEWTCPDCGAHHGNAPKE